MGLMNGSLFTVFGNQAPHFGPKIAMHKRVCDPNLEEIGIHPDNFELTRILTQRPNGSQTFKIQIKGDS